MAVDPEGRLVAIELNEASSRDQKVYYAPLQLLQYVWEWHYAARSVLDDVQALIDVRVG